MKEILIKIYTFFSVIGITYLIYSLLDKIGLIKLLGNFASLFTLFILFFVVYCEIKKFDYLSKNTPTERKNSEENK